MKPQHRTLFAFIAFLLAISLACYGGSPPPTETLLPPTSPPGNNTSESSPAPVIETQSLTEEPSLPQSLDFFTEEFDGDTSSWLQTVEKNNDTGKTDQADIYVENGRLIFDMGKWLIGYAFYEPYTYTDVKLDVRVDNRGTNVNNVLLVCRKSEEGHYLVNIANSGLFAMYAFSGSNNTYRRLANGGSTKIKAGKEINEYSLVCQEKTLTIYINGVETRSYTDNEFVFREGQVGIGVASEDQLPVKLEFEWIKISQP